MMMVANLVGFVIGMDGMNFFLVQLFGTWEGLRFMVLCCCCIFIGVQFMFEYRSVNPLSLPVRQKIVLLYREEELRQGIVRRF